MKPKSIAILGAESSGKTVLSQQLSEYFKCAVVYEFARTYLEYKEGKYGFDDLEIIAQEQVKRWFGAILQRPDMLIVDTDLTVLKVWSEMKFGKTSEWVLEHYENQQIDLYLLCENDLKWEDDPMRENPSLEERDEILSLYKEELIEHDRTFVLINGQDNARFEMAKEVIKKHFKI